MREISRLKQLQAPDSIKIRIIGQKKKWKIIIYRLPPFHPISQSFVILAFSGIRSLRPVLPESYMMVNVKQNVGIIALKTQTYIFAMDLVDSIICNMYKMIAPIPARTKCMNIVIVRATFSFVNKNDNTYV